MSNTRTQANDLLTNLYTSKEVDAVIKRLKPVHLQADILQHCFLELFERPAIFIIDLNERGKLKAYIVKTLYNTANFSRSKFAKENGKETPTDFNFNQTDGIDEGTNFKNNSFCHQSTFAIIKYENAEKDAAEVHKSVACAVSQLHWYKANLLQLYAELGTYKAVSEKTLIPVSCIFKTIRDTKKELKKAIL